MKTIKLNLKHVDPVKYATVATLSYLAVMLIIFVPILLLASLFGATQHLGGGLAMLGGGVIGIIFVLVFYGAIIFVVTLLASFILNYILKKTGGIPVEFEGNELDFNRSSDNFLNERN